MHISSFMLRGAFDDSTQRKLLHCANIAAPGSIAPSHDISITKDSWDCAVCFANLLRVLQLVLHGTAVATAHSISPGHNRPIDKESSKSAAGVLDVPVLIPHGTTVTTSFSTTTSQQIHRSEWQQKRRQSLWSAARSSADPAQHCCHHRRQRYPRSQRIHCQERQQKLRLHT